MNEVGVNLNGRGVSEMVVWIKSDSPAPPSNDMVVKAYLGVRLRVLIKLKRSHHVTGSSVSRQGQERGMSSLDPAHILYTVGHIVHRRP